MAERKKQLNKRNYGFAFQGKTVLIGQGNGRDGFVPCHFFDGKERSKHSFLKSLLYRKFYLPAMERPFTMTLGEPKQAVALGGRNARSSPIKATSFKNR